MTDPVMQGVRARQDPLRARYRSAPQEASITDRARAIGGTGTDPFHGRVVPGSVEYGVEWPFGIHRAVGGYHDAPNPGDMLCAALATCVESTIHMIADRLAVRLESVEVETTANVDVRGTLIVDKSVPVGFQSMRCRVRLKPAAGTDPGLVEKLFAAAEHSCVNLQTLRAGVPVETELAIA
jgi:uncharacterized OsmC-like protein